MADRLAPKHAPRVDVEDHAGSSRTSTGEELEPNNTKAETMLNAKNATEKEQNMTLMQVLISTLIVMEGFDIALINNLYGFQAFNQKFGVQQPDGTWQIPAAWQAGLSNGANVGEIIGLFMNGIISERIGYRYTVLVCLVLIAGFTAIFFTAQNVQTLLVAEILCGIPWGVFQTLTVTYASEV
jgi:SP family general alpha glucoside:H+ symporter-like MFS transporter